MHLLNKFLLMSILLFTQKIAASDFVEFVDASTSKSNALEVIAEDLVCGDVTTKVAFANSIKYCPDAIRSQRDVITDYTTIAIQTDDFVLTCLIGRYHMGHFKKNYANYREAHRLFNISMRQGNLNAYYYLGEIYEQG
ncbi:hypothetical protein [Shewanella aestuarii]|uniref:Sel1 repeat family protein n=1 Tax=Shewanella aestuarii TaxID=1028752 RepID=A0A6G9QRR2_9GAMM|nr:hypothetical protein [Shewanella aestuarii]QIR16499.1 hypothetical protein HBH39_18660 [Shewanella aestuarii]